MEFKHLRRADPALYRLAAAEIKRQNETIDLIPSENIAPPPFLEILGSPLVNKYSEGYPGRRYYPGNQYYDEIEKLAQERALRTFKLSPKEWAVNVQPYSGSPANLAVYFGLLEFGDKLMGMALASGGHLTHGHKVNFSGRAYQAIQYGVNPVTGLLDYEQIEFLAKKHQPKIIVSGLTAYPRKIDFKKIGLIAKKIRAYHLADVSHIAGLIAAGLHQPPFPYSDIVTMTTHKTLRGPRGAVIFSRREVAEKIDASAGSASTLSIAERVDRAVFPGTQGGPHNNVTAAIALMFHEAGKPAFKNYQKQIVKNARILADELKRQGFNLITGGTDNHLMLVDVRSFGLDGAAAEKRLEAVGILANRNSIPGDSSPFKPSGIRIGTPSVSSRGMKEKEMKAIAAYIYSSLTGTSPGSILKKVKDLCSKFPA